MYAIYKNTHEKIQKWVPGTSVKVSPRTDTWKLSPKSFRCINTLKKLSGSLSCSLEINTQNITCNTLGSVLGKAFSHLTVSVPFMVHCQESLWHPSRDFPLSPYIVATTLNFFHKYYLPCINTQSYWILRVCSLLLKEKSILFFTFFGLDYRKASVVSSPLK